MRTNIAMVRKSASISYPENLERNVNERASGFDAKLQIAYSIKAGTGYCVPKVMHIHSSFFKLWKIT